MRYLTKLILTGTIGFTIFTTIVVGSLLLLPQNQITKTTTSTLLLKSTRGETLLRWDE